MPRNNPFLPPTSVITPAPRPLASARWEGLRVGILGGSFNPAHAGHRHIALQAMIRFRLHAVWWLVSPGNPLKTKDPVPDLATRLNSASNLARHPRMVATDIEITLRTRYTCDTLAALTTLFPRTRFVWIAGMDNARQFHKWKNWQKLPKLVPFAFFDRPPASTKIKGNRLRGQKNLPQRIIRPNNRRIPGKNGIFWGFVGPCVDLSSTDLRKKYG